MRPDTQTHAHTRKHMHICQQPPPHTLPNLSLSARTISFSLPLSLSLSFFCLSLSHTHPHSRTHIDAHLQSFFCLNRALSFVLSLSFLSMHSRACVCTRTNKPKHTQTHTCTHAHTHAHKYFLSLALPRSPSLSRALFLSHSHAHTLVCTHGHTYMCIYTHPRIHSHAHIHNPTPYARTHARTHARPTHIYFSTQTRYQHHDIWRNYKAWQAREVSVYTPVTLVLVSTALLLQLLLSASYMARILIDFGGLSILIGVFVRVCVCEREKDTTCKLCSLLYLCVCVYARGRKTQCARECMSIYVSWAIRISISPFPYRFLCLYLCVCAVRVSQSSVSPFSSR